MRDLLAFPDTSRVWIYQANRPFKKDELDHVNQEVYHFVRDWTSHNHMLKATGGLIHDYFIVLVVDQSRAGASGCSIDKSVKFIQHLEQAYGQNMFDRMTFTYLEDQDVKTLHKSQLSAAYDSGEITDETLFFDNLVSNKGDYLKKWVVPFGDSWHRRMK